MNPPIVDEAIGTVHYGPLPAQRNLTALAVLQALTIAVMVAVAVFAYRSAMAAQRDRFGWRWRARRRIRWARRSPACRAGSSGSASRPTPPPDLADHLAADAERLERVAQRFERIGNPGRARADRSRRAGRSGGRLLPSPAPAARQPDRAPARGTRRGADGRRRSGAARVGAGGAGQERDRRAAGTQRHDYPAGRSGAGHGRKCG